MFQLFADAGLEQREDQLVAIAELARLDALPEHRDAIDDEALRVVVHKLNELVKAAEAKDDPKAALAAAVDDVLRSWEYRQSGDDEPAGADEAQS